MARKLVALAGIVAFLGGTAFGVTARAVAYEDSNVITITTGRGNVTEGYTFFCRATSATSVLLSWVGEKSEPHQLKVLGGDSEGSLSALATKSAGDGAFEDVELTAGITRYYQLKIDYDDSKLADEFQPAAPVSCIPFATIPQDPAFLNVTSLSDTSLYVTWKDNAVRPHNFVLERVKLTPLISTGVAAARTGGVAHVTWENQTNAGSFRGPYYHVVEWSNSSSFTAVSSSSVVFGEDRDYGAGTPRTSYEWTGTAPRTGTLYYRVKACSLLRVDYNHDGVLDDVCSVPAPEGGVLVAVAPASASYLASLWDAVRGAAAAAVDGVSNFFARLAEKISSVRFAAVVSGAQGDIAAYFSQFRQTLSPAANPSIYRDGNLDSDSVYLYRVKAVYTDGKAPAETFYTNEGAGKTFAKPAGELGNQENVNVCVRNNLCGPVTGLKFSGQPMVPQCTTNADCRDVGTSRQFFEETKER